MARFLNYYALEISKVSPTKLELSHDREDDTTAAVVNGICCSSMTRNSQDCHLTLPLKQKCSVAQQAYSCPEACPCRFRECSSYIMLDGRFP